MIPLPLRARPRNRLELVNAGGPTTGTFDLMIPDDIWLRLEKKLGGRKPLLDLLGITEYDKEI